MNYAKIKPVDVANGEGVRVSVFVSGCSHHCQGCFNAELWNYDAGQEFTWDTIGEILKLCEPSYITGLSVLGGEPMDPKNKRMVYILCESFKHKYPNKDIWLYTGYDFEDMRNDMVMFHVDVVVDGRFMQELADPRLKFRGSSNQRIIDVQKSLGTGYVVLRKDLM